MLIQMTAVSNIAFFKISAYLNAIPSKRAILSMLGTTRKTLEK